MFSVNGRLLQLKNKTKHTPRFDRIEETDYTVTAKDTGQKTEINGI